MTSSELPAQARAIDRWLRDALGAVFEQDAARFAYVLTRRRSGDHVQTRRLLTALVRIAVERRHPGGVDGEVVATWMTRTAAESSWLPDDAALDPWLVGVVLAGAFGVDLPANPDPTDDGNQDGQDEEQTPPPDPDEVTRHAVLLLATLLREPDDDAEADAVLDRALLLTWAELARADHQDD
jgi:hypothetical protein